MVFGIPTFVLSILCYTLCCLEPADENEPYEGSDDEDDIRENPESERMASVLWPIIFCVLSFVIFRLFIWLCNSH